MNIEIIEETPERLKEYETVSIAFLVETQFRIELIQDGLGGIKFLEEPVSPFIKDYDEYGKPLEWTQWDISSWGILSAFVGDERVGGAAVAWNASEIVMLEGRKDLACLWDLRVHPDYRNKGVGHRLFTYAVEWVRERGCCLLKVETQNINVAACRFYARQGCELGAINRYAYHETLNETQLLWYLNI